MKRLVMVLWAALGISQALAQQVLPGTIVPGSNLSSGVTTSAGGSAPRSLSSRALDIGFNPLDFGAKCDGTTVDTAAITATNSTANANGSGRVQFPAGTCISGQQIIYPNIAYVGMGRNVTTVKAASGTNAALFLGQNFASLVGTNSTAGVGAFSFRDLTIDGNNANNSSGDGIQVYGYGFIIDSITIKNTASDGLYTEWSNSSSCPSNSPPDCMEAFFGNLEIHGYAGNGWVYAGPHDSIIDKAIIFTFSNVNAKGLWLTGSSGKTAGLIGGNIHVWGQNLWGIYSDSTSGYVNLSTVESEGATAGQLMNGGFQNQWHNLIVFAQPTVNITASITGSTTLNVTVNGSGLPLVPGMVITSGAGVTAATRITAGSGLTGTFTITSSSNVGSEAMGVQGAELWYGDSANSGSEFVSTIDMTANDGGGISWVYEGGDNLLRATFQTASPLLIGNPAWNITDTIAAWDFTNIPGQMALTSCGGGTPNANGAVPAVGSITLGTGAPTTCVATVQAGMYWAKAPICTVSSNNGAAWGVVPTTTSLTFSGAVANGSTTLNWICHP